ncbi:hypothetical protein B0H11DRAFT_1872745 [Mycena galericulata]|nr:hypothetical protein B0H11DRAFT_1872745 [Mycena galericulata]
MSPPPNGPVTYKNIHLLYRPSPYIRFDEIHRPSPPVPRQFNNYPITLAQIDAEDEGRVFPNDHGALMSPIGTIVPEDRRISTVIQFRTIDWGMEECELKLSLPALNKDAQSSGISVVLHRLNQTYRLDDTTLSYQSRPPRVSKVATIQLAQDVPTLWQQRFRCKSDGVLTFELECSPTHKSNCLVDWRQRSGSVEPYPGESYPRS